MAAGGDVGWVNTGTGTTSEGQCQAANIFFRITNGGNSGLPTSGSC